MATAKSRRFTGDVTAEIKSSARHRVFFAALFGFALGALLATIPLATHIVAFGVVGTLMFATFECAAIAGCFAVWATALYRQDGDRGRPAMAPFLAARRTETGSTGS